MDPRKLQFLQAVVGHDGARALAKAAEHAAELDQAVFPRTILAWIDVMGRFGHEGSVPGVENVKLTFAKSEEGFDGYVTLDGELHRFEGASVNHLAGCIAVALGLDHERVAPTATPQKLAKLGKSIDLLVKSRVVKAKLDKDEKSSDKKVKLPGTTAQPRGPIPPQAPIAKQPENAKQQPAGAAGTAMTPPLPQTSVKPKKKPTASITKSDSLRKCPMCGKGQFALDKYVGCYCFGSLAKSVKTTAIAGGYTLEFNGLDEDTIATMLEGLRGK